MVRRRDGGGIVVELWRGGVGTEVGWSGDEMRWEEILRGAQDDRE